MLGVAWTAKAPQNKSEVGVIMRKPFSVLFVLGLICALLIPTAQAAPTTKVSVQGEEVAWTDAQPFIDANNRTLVPLRPVANAMGLKVDWDPVSRIASFSKQGCFDDGTTFIHTLDFTIDDAVAVWDTRYFDEDGSLTEGGYSEIEMDTAAVVVGNRTYAPIRYLAEAFGYKVGWSEASRTVTLTKETHVLKWDYFANWEDYVGIYYYPGERIDELGSVETVSAMINGEAAEFVVFSAQELEELNEDFGEALRGEALYAFYINSPYEFINDETYFIEWEVVMTHADGRVAKPETLTWVYEHSGVGGY